MYNTTAAAVGQRREDGNRCITFWVFKAAVNTV